TEFTAFGFPFTETVSRFAESFEIIRRLIAGEHVTFHGKYHTVKDAVLLPTPARRIPLMLGSNGARMLSIALPHVAAWNTWYTSYGNTVDGFAKLSARIDEAAHQARPRSLTPISGQSPVRADGAFRRLGGHVSRLAKWLGRTSAPPRVDRVVVGLGNPGDGYANTRHNVGFQVASRLAKRARADFAVKAAESRIAEGAIDGVRLAIARPQTFMNDSGRAVRKLLDRYRADPDALFVVYDDVDLPLGKIRIRERGGPGTHNGMRSIVSEVGEGFAR